MVNWIKNEEDLFREKFLKAFREVLKSEGVESYMKTILEKLLKNNLRIVLGSLFQKDVKIRGAT